MPFLLAAVAAVGQTSDETAEYKQFLAKIHAAMGLRNGSVVADIGSGDSPDHPMHIAKAIGASSKLVCEDIDGSALRKLGSKLREAGIENVEFVVGEHDNPKLPPHTFDAIIISNAYHQFTDPQPMLDYIRKVLKGSGRLVILEAFTAKTQSRPREEQVKVHELAPALLESELQSAGFRSLDRIILREDQALTRYLVSARPQ